MLDIYSLLYGEFFYCKDCDFEFSKLGQVSYSIEGCCPACGEPVIDYLPVKYIKEHIKRLKEELQAIDGGTIEMELTKEEKLEIINSMKFEDSDGNGDCLYYVFVADNEENRGKLAKVVPSVEGYIAEYASDNEIHECEPGHFDVQMAVWDYTEANYFDGKQFIIDKEIN